MKLRKLFGNKDNQKHAPAAQMPPILRAMAAEIPRWPPHRRPLMEKIVIEANAAGVSSMEEFFTFLDHHPDLSAGFYAITSESLASGGMPMDGAQQAIDELETSVVPGKAPTVTIGGETLELSPDGLAANPELSIKFNSTLLEDVRNRGDRYGEAAVLGELGLAHARLNQLQKAIYYFERHLEIAREVGNWQWLMEDYRNLGRANLELGNVERAGAVYTEAVQLARQRDDRRWDIEHSLCLASVYARQGNIVKAAELKNHAMALQSRGGK